MRKLGLLLALVLGGCLGSYDGDDSSQQQRSENPPDLATAIEEPSEELDELPDLAPPPDLAEPPDLTPPGPRPFGGDCVAPADCEQGLLCEVFTIMNKPQGKCTRACTIANQANDCPKPPSTGICTTNQVCGF